MADQRFCAAKAEVGSRSDDIGDGTRRSAMDPPPCTAARRLSRHLLVPPSLVLTLFWLWSRTDDQPWLAVSGICLLMCCYMHSWTISLSSHAMGAADLFERVLCTVLLAFLANCAVTPFAGMAALYFATVHAAGSLGYAIAEHRGSDDGDASGDEIIFDDPSRMKRTPPPRVSKSILSLLCATRVLWVACTYAPGDAAVAIVEFSLVTTACLYLWMCLVHVWLLHSALLSGDCLTGLLGAGVMTFGPVTGVVDHLFADPGFVCLVWPIVMAIAGCFGYTVGIYHRYQQRLHHLGRTKLLPKGKNEQSRGHDDRGSDQRAESDKPKPLHSEESEEN